MLSEEIQAISFETRRRHALGTHAISTHALLRINAFHLWMAGASWFQ